jgi:L-amino acid N-acyltransferase YncA
LERLRKRHWPDVARIYAEGISTGDATFETAVPHWQDWDRSHRPDCRLVAIADGNVVGWVALRSVSSREAYAGVAEVSVYVAEGARGQGIGASLLQTIVDQSEASGIWTLQAGIFPENRASIALHKRCGFRVVGVRRRVGQLAGVWRHVLLMERRSELKRFR